MLDIRINVLRSPSDLKVHLFFLRIITYILIGYIDRAACIYMQGMLCLYTPGSTSGLPVNLVDNFDVYYCKQIALIGLHVRIEVN